MGSAFDKIAKKSNGTAKTADKVAATVNDEVKSAVDLVLAHKQEISRLEAELADKQDVIARHVRPQSDQLGFDGNYTKSMTVEGNKGSILITYTDKWNVPQEDTILKEIQKTTGKLYAEFFPQRRSISMTEAALKDEATLNKVAEACKKAGLPIDGIFDVVDKVVACKGLDEKVYKLTPEKLATLRTLIKQNKPSLK